MKLLRTWLLGVIVLMALSSCGLFKPDNPHDGGDRRAPLVLDQPAPEDHRGETAENNGLIDYLLPWRLARHARD